MSQAILEIKGNRICKFGGNSILEIKGKRICKFGGNSILEIKGNRICKYGGNSILEIKGNRICKYGGNSILEIKGSRICAFNGATILEIKGKIIRMKGSLPDSLPINAAELIGALIAAGKIKNSGGYGKATQLKKLSYALLVLGLLYFIPEEVFAKILTPILEFVGNLI